MGAIVLSGVVVLDEVESDSLEGGLDPVGGVGVEDPLKVIGVGHALLRRVPRALTGATEACAGWRRLIGSRRRRRERAAVWACSSSVQPRALTGVTKACAGWRRLNRTPKGRASSTRVYRPCMSLAWRVGVGVTGLRGPDHCVGVTGLRGPDPWLGLGLGLGLGLAAAVMGCWQL